MSTEQIFSERFANITICEYTMDTSEKDVLKKEILNDLINCVKCEEQKRKITSIIAVIIIIGCFGFFLSIAYLLKDKTEIITQLIAIFQSLFTLVLAYYFGTSKGSDDKNKTIDKFLNNQNNN